jgi:hypothetical protein
VSRWHTAIRHGSSSDVRHPRQHPPDTHLRLSLRPNHPFEQADGHEFANQFFHDLLGLLLRINKE